MNQKLSPLKTIDTFKKIVTNFSKVKVLVIGDLMWDEYIHGECNRISPEAPVPVVLIKDEKRVPGGATNVLKNLVDLKVLSGIMGIVGADKNGREMSRELNKWHLNLVQLWESPDRPTIVKTRILARHQQLMRLDRETSLPFPVHFEKKLLEILKQEIKKFNAVILSDYNKGMFTPTLIQGIIKICKAANVYVAVDPQVKHFKLYKGADLMTPNEKEAAEGIELDFPEKQSDVNDIGQRIQKELKLKHLLITRSHNGMALFERNKTPVYVPTVAREVFDVSGAGDTVIAVFATALMAGATPLQATLISNIAGGIVVGKLGTATINKKEILENLDTHYLNL